ncbi:DUF4870 domain-containing protein [Abyssisolibacter fermentans]|uniref:DUF4870 domain-containing protein n=1 Tax=Abyssisolibacter fermentans TaxID=1766203 RepID=UPI000833B5F2|nr:DUF4870 domain-containing protein [Abyssisolibacter fermentans]
MLNSQQKLLCSVSHLGIFVGLPIVAPLIVLFLSNDNFVKTQAKEAIAFQLGMVILGAIIAVLTFGLLFFVSSIINMFFSIVAIVNILNDVDYSYPVTSKFIRK